MYRFLVLPALSAALLLAGVAPLAQAAEQAYVKILSPANGAKLDAMAQNKITYEVQPGPRGDHVHVYVDDKEVGILRQLKGSYTLETLSPGNHDVCIKVVNKAHVPIGVERCIKVSLD
ncbi:MAG: hypothetical protein ACOY4L_03850 [Pseudomonadota bacterium]